MTMSFDSFTLITSHPWLDWLLVVILGAIFGSFLGCVAYRLPLMLEQSWRRAAEEMFEHEEGDSDTEATISLVRPRSFCPQCRTVLSPLYLVPLLGYLFSGGRCRHCRERVPLSYPAIELAAVALFCWIYGHFGATLQAILAIGYGCSLLLLLVIDARRHLLPDVIVLPVLWLGLVVSYAGVFIDFDQSFLGAIIGFGVFFSLYWIFLGLTGRESLGRGDIKLLAMLGVWSGVYSIPVIIFAASCGGLVWLLLRRAMNKGAIHDPLAFGPFLIIPGWVSFLYGTDWFFDFSSLIQLWQQL